MKIVVNTRLLLPYKMDGIGWFTYETLKRITASHPEHQFYFIFDRPYAKEFVFQENITPIVAFPPARHPILWYLFFQFGLKAKLKKIKPDLFLSTDGWIPLNTAYKIVNVIHDLNFEHYPEFLKPNYAKYLKKYFNRFARQSNRIATVSEYSKNDISKTYNIPIENIDVVYNGCNTSYKPISEIDKNKIKREFSHNCNYFLFIGTIHKRKNLDNIFRAFDRYKSDNNSDMKLVVVGDKKWWKGDIKDSFLAMRHKSDVIFLGHLPADKLGNLLSAATAIVYVSLFEGFGIPILEAFSAETPLITSNVSSMPEIAGDAAILINPLSVEEISSAMKEIVENIELKNRLIQKGKERLRLFSWDKTANLLWQTIDKVMND